MDCITARVRRGLLSLCLALAYRGTLTAQNTVGINVGWLPITDAERQLSSPKVDASAGVEAIFWRVHVADELQGGQTLQRVMHHYIRLKVFTEAGKEKAATVEIPYTEQSGILSISGRTVKRDGSVKELDTKTIHDRDVVRIGRMKRKVKSFAMPSVEPGDIVEYRWKENVYDKRIRYARLHFQRDIPIHRVSYFIKPLSYDFTGGLRLSLWPFNCKPTPLHLENNGYNSTHLDNVPAFGEEPLMPSEPNVKAWALLLYREGNKKPEEYWEEVGKKSYNELKRVLKIGDEVKQATAKALEGVREDQKLIAIIRYLRKSLRNLFDPAVTEAERADVIREINKERRTSAEILKSRIALPNEMNVVFAAMATHAGFEARPVLVADRDEVLFHPTMTDDYFLGNIDMAVKTPEGWRLYDASARRLFSGQVSWREEGMAALLSDPKKPEFIKSPLSPPGASGTQRQAKLTLSADGDLEGTVQEQISGHSAADRRDDFEGESAEKQAEVIRKEVQRVFPNAEVSEISVKNADDTEEPLLISYRIQIAGYAQATGKRLFFAPLFFQRGATPLLQSTDRKYDLHFRYAWLEQDVVSIRLPEGFQLENAETPGDLSLGDPGGYRVVMRINPDNELVASREFLFGDKGHLFWPRDVYPKLKQAFDEIHKRDQHTLAVRRP